MNCPRCGSSQVSVQMVTHSARTRKRGCLWGLIRLTLIICTFGSWLIIGKSKSKTNYCYDTNTDQCNAVDTAELPSAVVLTCEA